MLLPNNNYIQSNHETAMIKQIMVLYVYASISPK